MSQCDGGTGWQNRVYAQLRDMQWHNVGDLFEAVEKDIPLHHAMRATLQLQRRGGGLPSDGGGLPSNFEARWRLFRTKISLIGVDSEPPISGKGYQWGTRIRLRYVAGRVCEVCDGPVIKSGWTARKGVVCLACAAGEPVGSAVAPVVESVPRLQSEMQAAVSEFREPASCDGDGPAKGSGEPVTSSPDPIIDGEPAPALAQPPDRHRAGRRGRRRGSRRHVRDHAATPVQIVTDLTETLIEHTAPLPPPVAPVAAPVVVPIVVPIVVSTPAQASSPILPPGQPSMVAYQVNGHVVSLHARKERHIAWYLKRFLGGSINALERELERERHLGAGRAMVPNLLVKHGSSWERFTKWLGQTYGWFRAE